MFNTHVGPTSNELSIICDESVVAMATNVIHNQTKIKDNRPNLDGFLQYKYKNGMLKAGKMRY